MVDFKKIFIIGLTVRLLFAPWTGHNYDLPIWLDSGQKLANGISPYTSYIHLGQTILWAIWTAFSYLISTKIFSSNLFVEIFVIKLLPIAVDIVLPIEIIYVLNNHSGRILTSKETKNILIAIWLNPYFIIISSWWAMIDNLAFLFILISLELIIDNYISIPVLLTSLAIGLKLYPVIFLPGLALIVLFKSRSLIRSFVYAFGVVSGFFLIAYLPFYLFNWNSNAITGVFESQLTRTSGGVTILGILTDLTVGNSYSSMIASFYQTINNIQLTNELWLVFSVLISGYYFLNYFYQKRKNQEFLTDKSILFVYSVDMLITYFIIWLLTAKWVSEQNFIPLICFLFIKYFIKFDKPKEQNKLKSYIIYLSSLLLLFLIFNTPIFAFFWLFIDIQSFENQIPYFYLIRSLILALTTVGVIFICLKILGVIYNDRNTIQNNS